MISSRRKLIEVALPLEAINRESAPRKRKAPAGYPTMLHKWWAQRPLAACRAVLFASTVTTTKNQIPTGLNLPDDFIDALIEIRGGTVTLYYFRRSLWRAPDSGATRVNYDFGELLSHSEEPA
jgi:adenine-specific DNA methylase